MTMRMRFMVLQTLSFRFRTGSIHRFDWDPHERPYPSAPSKIPASVVPPSIPRQGNEPVVVHGQWSFGLIGTWTQRSNGDSNSFFAVVKGEYRCGGEVEYFFSDFPSPLLC